MNSYSETKKVYDAPVFAGTYRVLLGLAALIVGVYLLAFAATQTHGIGCLLIMGSPFLFLTDEK